MHWEADRHTDEWGEPSLAEMTEKAINMLKRSPNGYFLEIEGIHSCHTFFHLWVIP